MKFRTFLTTICLSTLILSGCSSLPLKTAPHAKLLALPDHTFTTFKIHNQLLKMEVVNTPASTTQGLSGRDQIGSDGLLFIFPQLQLQRFWMKEMKFDLDFVWLANLTIVDLTGNVSRPLSSTEQLPIYSPKAAVNEVLEIPAGTINMWQLHIGDTFVLAQ